MRRDREAECVEREETWGGVFPHHLTRGLGSVVSSPSGVLSPKWILCIFEVRKKPSGAPFSVFLSDGGPPNVAGPGKTSPLSPPSRRACAKHTPTGALTRWDFRTATPCAHPTSEPRIRHCQIYQLTVCPIFSATVKLVHIHRCRAETTSGLSAACTPLRTSWTTM